MPPEVWAALVAGVLGVLGGLGSGEWRRRREKRDKAAELVGKYRDPLLRAAFDLQSRLYNIVRFRFLDTYYVDADDRDRAYAEMSTLWIIGQYFGWVEILRREVQFLDLGGAAQNRELQRHLAAISRVFASDDRNLDRNFRVFRADQRAIGELMIVRRPPRQSDSLGYSEFLARQEDPRYVAAFDRLRADLRDVSRSPRDHLRLRLIQRALVDLMDILDADHTRYPDESDRGRLPLRRDDTTARERLERPLASFFFDLSNEAPWDVLEIWAKKHEFVVTERQGGRRQVRGSIGRGAIFDVDAYCDDGWLGIDACVHSSQVRTRIDCDRPSTLPLSPKRLRSWRLERRAREPLEELLTQYGEASSVPR